jgi:hypothetical protein
VVQELVLDVDGDGSDDRIYSVVVMLPERQSYGFSFSALFLASGRRPGQMDLLYRQDSDAIVVRGTLDLDADSNRELWILFSSTDGADDAHAVLSLRRGRPAVVGRYSCRPRTD